MIKLGRNYNLRIANDDSPFGTFLEVTPPFTMEFDVTRNTLSSANVAQIRIYNLAAASRNKARFNISNYGTYRQVILKAGYGDDMAEIFRGNISQAWSYREGVDWITQIECYDGGFGFVNGFASFNAVAGDTNADNIRKAMAAIPHTTVGAIGNYSSPLPMGNAYNGNPVNLLRELTGEGFFTDLEKNYALQNDEYFISEDETLVINSGSGLLGTPLLEQSIVRINMILEPRLKIGTSVIIDSSTGVEFNGRYKIIGVKHRGIISDVVSGDAVTTGEFYYSKLLTGRPLG